jgi:polyisoprenoid-binding protein YceI
MVTFAGLARPLVWLMVFAAATDRLEAQQQTHEVDLATSRVRIHLGRARLMSSWATSTRSRRPSRRARRVVDGDPARSGVALRFESARLSVVPGSEPAADIPKVEERMRGPEVLDVARYPEVAFVSTSVRSQAQNGSHFLIVVSGTLRLRGRAFPVEVPLEVARDTHGIVARGGLGLNLRDLGIEPPSVAGVVNVANRFRLEFEIRATAAPTPGVTP